MSVLIAVVAQETGRFNTFPHSLTALDMPEGSAVRWRFGWDVAEARNALARQALDEGFDWVWFMDDDHAFSPDLLEKLLARDLDIVVPLCLMRNAPYRPVVWVAPNCEGEDWSEVDPEDAVERLDLSDHPDGGLVEIAAAGAAGLLIRRSVLERGEPPWFESGTGITARVGEDVNFCRKARAAGFRIWIDLDALLGHCATTVVWPVREPDGWTFGLSMIGGFHVTLPPGFQGYADGVANDG